MKNKSPDSFILELLAYTMFAVAAVCFVYYLFYLDPVNFALFVTEDHWGENCTAISFGISGIAMIWLAFKHGIHLQKVIWVLFGIALIIIAGEEISWGMRIFRISVPEIMKEANLQGEINLHNLAVVRFIMKKVYVMTSYIIISWLVFSITVDFFMPLLRKKIRSIGLPLISLKFVPIFSLPIYFWLFYPIDKSYEMGEMFFGISITFFVANLFVDYSWKNKKYIRLKAFGVVIFFIVIMSLALTCIFSLPSNHVYMIRYRLDYTAKIGYPNFRMYEQAQVLYDYIYDHPEYIYPETRIDHGKMLINAGKPKEALHVLFNGYDLLLKKKNQGNCDSKDLKRLRSIHALIRQLEQDGDLMDNE